MEQLEHLLIQRGPARVVLEGPASSLREIARYCHPYYNIKTVRAVPEGVWRILCGRTDADFNGWAFYESVVRNEPTRRIRYDLRSKTLAVVTVDSQWLCVFTGRLLRDLLRWQLLGADTLFFQACLVKIQETGIAIGGPPRVGKTSTALALVGCEKARFIADNDLLCIIEENSVFGMGWPRSICIRRDTIPILEKWWPRFGARIESFTHPNNHNPTGGVREFLHLSPGELSELSQTAVLAEAPVSAFIFPEFTEGNVAPRLTRISEDEATARLTEIWDFLPERKVGQRSSDAFEGKRTWKSLCFNPFLADAFLISEPDQLRLKVRKLSSVLPCYVLKQPLSHVARSAEIIAKEIGGLPPVRLAGFLNDDRD